MTTKLDEALALPAGRELDAIVGQTCGFEPDWWIGASRDGGESWSAIVNRRDGPWYSERELQEWIAVEHSQRRFLDYEVLKREWWPKFSTEIEAAWQVVEKLKDHLPELVWRCGDSEPLSEMRWWCYFRRDQTTGPDCHGAAAETAPLAICRAALKALWKD